MSKNTEDLLKDATVMLSDLSEALVLAIPQSDLSTLNRIHLYRYRGSRLVVVLISNEGVIKNRIIETDYGLAQKDLNRISDYLNSEYQGCPIRDIRSALVARMSQEKAIADILISRAVNICNDALSFPEGDVYMSGLSKLLGLPEFQTGIERVVRAIEDKHRMLALLESIAAPEGVRVVIGSECPDEGLRDASILVASFALHGRPLGTLGIIGPMRMDYSRMIPLVEEAARVISRSMDD